MFTQTSEGTNLSAEVPPFVPRRTRIDEGVHPSNQLPRYLTTCFPFVQEQQDRRHPNGSPNVPSFNQAPPWPPQLYASAMFGQFNPRFNIGMLRINEAAGNLADSSQSDAVGSSQNPPKHNSRPSSSKTEEKQKSGKVLKKNVGVQIEVGGAGSDEEGPPKMTDSGQQTDFPSNIASKSLTDKPSPLKKVRNSRSKSSTSHDGSRGSSTDPADADVDSDSGYYSPKRRMNHKKSSGNTANMTNVAQAVNPLHPVMFLPPGSIPPSLFFASPHSSSPQLSSNALSHVTPPPNPNNLGFVLPEAPLMVNPPPNSLMNPVSMANRPPPGFPIPPSMLKPHESMQVPDGWMWNGAPGFPPNVPPPQAPFTQFQPPNSNNRSASSYPANKKKTPMQPHHASSQNQSSQIKNRKAASRSRINRESNQPEPHYHGNNEASSRPDANAALYLQDAEEFPGLEGSSFVQSSDLNNKLSYSQALTQKPGERLSSNPMPNNHASSRPHSKSGAEPGHENNQKLRKRWKKEERAAKEAEKEYAEISKEQEAIKKALKKTASHRNRKQNAVLDLGDIFSKLERGSSKKSGQKKIQVGGGVAPMGTRSLSAIHQRQKPALRMGTNPLDATAPSVRRGKERETPKPKKPSAMKKVILKEREEKKEQRLQQLSTMDCPDHDVPPYPNAILNPVAVASGASTEDEEPTVSSKLSQLTIDDVPSNVPQIHSRRYREYCSQVLDKKIDDTCTLILQKLVYFQDRMYQRDPIKAKMRRRLVMGIREVTKHLKLKKLKCVIISPNLEKIQSKGGLDEALQQILNLCQEQNVTYIFALGRKAMGRAVSKLVPVSIVGIFDYSGVDDHYKQLVTLVTDAQNEYKEMVAVYQQEVIKANTPSVSVPSASTKRFAHMTHSRNPSAASCVSFASFISEPISELNEDSNWRVLMDADEPTLPPTAEDDGSISEEDGGGEEEPGKLSRKDSECTVVECNAVQEDFVEANSGELVKPSSLDKLSSCDSSEYKDAKSQNSKQFQNFDDSSPITSPESEKSLPIPTNPVAEPGTPETSYLAGEGSLTIASMDSSSSVQDRVQMWLDDSHCSISTEKEEAEPCTDDDIPKNP